MPEPGRNLPPMTKPEAEIDWLARYRDGDAQAFRQLVQEYHERLLQFYFRVCHDRAQAEDLAQELFLKLLARVDSYQPRGKLSVYVFRVAMNLWIDQYRRVRLRPRLFSYDQFVSTPGGDPVRSEPAAPVISPVQRLVDQENIDALRAALGRLGETSRCVLELAVFQQLPYAEISTILGIPTGTVKSRVHHAVASLKELLGEASGRRAVVAGKAVRLGA
jgi:RNA polymerase sigma-70 factor, ECF subfamily